MNLLKNILFVSYLKNKGVRRICFIVGILFAILPAMIWYENLNDNFYNETYKNILEFGRENEYDTEKQRAVFDKYPADVGIKDLNTFHDWKKFLFDDYGKGYETRRYYLEQCYLLKNKKEIKLPEGFHIIYSPDYNSNLENRHQESMRFKIKSPDEELIEVYANKQPTKQDVLQIFLFKNQDKLKIMCPKFKEYMVQRISISRANYLYFSKFLYSLFWFYLPFLLACIIRWIYTGFKENKVC